MFLLVIILIGILFILNPTLANLFILTLTALIVCLYATATFGLRKETAELVKEQQKLTSHSLIPFVTAGVNYDESDKYSEPLLLINYGNGLAIRIFGEISFKDGKKSKFSSPAIPPKGYNQKVKLEEILPKGMEYDPIEFIKQIKEIKLNYENIGGNEYYTTLKLLCRPDFSMKENEILRFEVVEYRV